MTSVSPSPLIEKAIESLQRSQDSLQEKTNSLLKTISNLEAQCDKSQSCRVELFRTQTCFYCIFPKLIENYSFILKGTGDSPPKLSTTLPEPESVKKSPAAGQEGKGADTEKKPSPRHNPPEAVKKSPAAGQEGKGADTEKKPSPRHNPPEAAPSSFETSISPAGKQVDPSQESSKKPSEGTPSQEASVGVQNAEKKASFHQTSKNSDQQQNHSSSTHSPSTDQKKGKHLPEKIICVLLSRNCNTFFEKLKIRIELDKVNDYVPRFKTFDLSSRSLKDDEKVKWTTKADFFLFFTQTTTDIKTAETANTQAKLHLSDRNWPSSAPRPYKIWINVHYSYTSHSMPVLRCEFAHVVNFFAGHNDPSKLISLNSGENKDATERLGLLLVPE